MKAFVTGAAGFVGTHLVKQLVADGHEVTILIHRTPPEGLDGLPVKICKGSIENLDELSQHMKGAEAVFHLASMVSIDPNDGEILHRINVEGAKNIAEACVANGVTRLVHVSSVHAFESSPVDATYSEESPAAVAPHHHPYDRSKALGEQAVLDAGSRGLEVVVVNPAGIMGPEDRKPTPVGEMLLQLYLHQIPGVVNAGFYWVDVRDVANGIRLAHQHGKPGRRYILAGEYASIPQISKIVGEVPGASPPRLVTPMWLAKLFAPAMGLYSKITGSKLLYTRTSLEMLCQHQKITGNRATLEIQFQPRPIRETIHDTLAWYREDGRL